MLLLPSGQIERFAPGFRDLILARHTMNCAAMERYNPNYIGGDIAGAWHGLSAELEYLYVHHDDTDIVAGLEAGLETILVKLARLDELLKGKTPKHESIEDSLLDLSVYSALWAS